MKATDPKNSPDPVSRPSNEEIETNKNGDWTSTRERYTGNDDHQPNSGIDNRRLGEKGEVQSGHLGQED